MPRTKFAASGLLGQTRLQWPVTKEHGYSVQVAASDSVSGLSNAEADLCAFKTQNRNPASS